MSKRRHVHQHCAVRKPHVHCERCGALLFDRLTVLVLAGAGEYVLCDACAEHARSMVEGR